MTTGERSHGLAANGNTFVFFLFIFRSLLVCSLKRRTSKSVPNAFLTNALKMHTIYIGRYTEIWQPYGIFTHLSVKWESSNVKSHILHQNARTEPRGHGSCDERIHSPRRQQLYRAPHRWMLWQYQPWNISQAEVTGKPG